MMEKAFDPKNLEQKWYQDWESKNYFAPTGVGEAYCISIPPPNVTGRLHMGHGFQLSIMDALIRYHKMSGFNTLWQVGTDHAGIATQLLVEQQLRKKGKTRHDLGREKFIEKVWEWKKESKDTITNQQRRLGICADWSRERFTLDEGLSQAVKKVFIELFNQDLIYRGQRLVNWDPVLHTAISDLEVLNKEKEGHLWYIRYPLVDSDEHLVVATTRPETMLGDVAIAVNPKDQRFEKLVGKHAKLPLTDRTIPIIADDYVETEFGTGCVKITPAHDFNDYAIGKRHSLPLINILTPNADLNENVPEKYQGMERFAARKAVLKDLTELDLLEKTEKYTNKIPVGDRSGSIIEPYLTYQWFVRAKPLADAAIKVLDDDEFGFIPENWSKTYLNWMNNIEDWCISRQLWWGHRIPAWFDQDGKVYVGETEEEIRAEHKLDEKITLTQDEDVLDTWFSAGLWPFSTLGWPEKTPELETFYPTNVLVTGFDIIFFWVARMVMMGVKFTDKVPFNDVYITGIIRDSHGQKMSKSKGNILDPLDLVDGISLNDLIEKRTSNLLLPELTDKIIKQTKEEFPNGIEPHGVDALRFTFCSLATQSNDINFDIGRLAGNRNFCNKIWNATRYVLLNCEETLAKNPQELSSLTLNNADKWIISRLQKFIQETHKYYKEYRFDLLCQATYDFIWNEYCDWYLELAKPILNGDNEELKLATQCCLVNVLETLLRILHPLMPFISEELWQKVAPLTYSEPKDSIMLCDYPKYKENKVDEAVEKEIDWLKAVVMAIRNIRGEMNISPNKKVEVILAKGNKDDRDYLAKNSNYLEALAKLSSIRFADESETITNAATAISKELEIYVPLEGLIDFAAEKARLEKEIAKLNKDLTIVKQKLANDNFVKRAPAELVASEKERLKDLTFTISKLEEKKDQIAE